MTLLYEEYSPWKGVHFLDRLNIVKSGGVCSPVSLQLGLTNKCSNKCYYCYVKEQNNLGETLKTDAVVNLLEEAKMMGVKSVEITGGGEPTLHPDFWDIVDKIRDLDLELGLVTNGLHLKSDKIHKLDFVSWVRISIDSYNPTIYKEIRGANLLNLEPIMKLCKETNVIVGASCVITPKNYQEIYEFAKMSKDLGFSHVWFKPVEMSDNPTILNQYLDVCEENIKKASMLADSNFKVFSPNLKAEVQGIMKPFLKCICQ
ncbi:MAG: radical SAM protein, partial [Paenibacillus macerans]